MALCDRPHAYSLSTAHTPVSVTIAEQQSVQSHCHTFKSDGTEYANDGVGPQFVSRLLKVLLVGEAHTQTPPMNSGPIEVYYKIGRRVQNMETWHRCKLCDVVTGKS